MIQQLYNDEEVRGMSILCVDDVPTNLKLINQILMARGYHVFCAPSGEIALELLDRLDPDLVLLDIMMPGISGFETAARIKANPRLAELPILFLSAKDDAESITRGLETGGVDYICKPFNEAEVCARVKAHLMIRKRARARSALIRELEEDLTEQEGQLSGFIQRFSENARERSDFMILFAHEIRTPLTVLSGSLKILESMIHDLEKKDALARTLKMAAKAQLRLFHRFEDIFELNLLSQEGAPLKTMPFPLRGAVETARKNCRREIKSGVEFLNHVPEALVLEQDREKLLKLLGRLIDNAARATEEGSIQVFSKIAGDSLELRVLDTGPGIELARQDRLFQLFRVGHEIEHHQEGFGLGLPLARKAAEAMGGTLHVFSPPRAGEGHGTEALLTLPLKAVSLGEAR